MISEDLDIRKIFGNNVKKYRELRGWTQEEFIEKIGIGPSAISNIECGKSFPLPSNINKIIEVLNVEPGLLFTSNSNNKSDKLKSIVNEVNQILLSGDEEFATKYRNILFTLNS